MNKSLTELSGVGPRIAECLQRLGLTTLQDLLFHLPLRYQDRTRITPIGNLREGDDALIEGKICSAAAMSGGRRPSLLCQLTDGTGIIQLRFFYFTAQQKTQFSVLGAGFRCYGEVRSAYRQGLEIIHPEYRRIQDVNDAPLDDRLTPIYPTTKGLSQTLLRRLTDYALQNLQQISQTLELLPEALLTEFQLTDLLAALRYVHRPPPEANVDLLLQGEHPMQKRLAFEELLAHNLCLQQSRYKIQQQHAPALADASQLRQTLMQHLGFQLTGAQQRVIAEIDQDLSHSYPMLRLLQGDVGSGKTIVAAMTMLRAVAQGYQTVLMAPTEILAEQHWQKFCEWMQPLGIKVGFLTGKQNTAMRKQTLECIASGEYPIIIGTHALFQESVEFQKLALLIIDEQHRFGVQQRLALKEKGLHPHQLIMSATPIPRTLAMVAYADLDISIIDELPPGRKPIVTALVSNQRRAEVIERVRSACKNHQQVYWVCTLIADSEVLQCQAAEALAEELQVVLAELRIGLIHSRLTSEQKNAIMTAFKQGNIDLLVATTVIEVGVDVPNASLMIIENPERLGLAQLHQLRGRVGRGANESFCVLLFQRPLSTLAQQRLQVMRDTNDGFVIAREDLAIRGPGEVLGVRQAGLLQLKVANLLRDQVLLPKVQSASQYLIEKFPERVQQLIWRWIQDTERFGQV